MNEQASSEQPNRSAEQDQIDREVEQALGDLSVSDLLGDPQAPVSDAPTMQPAASTSGSRGAAKMTRGKIVAIHEDDVFVDVGGKSQGIINRDQFDSPPEIGQEMDFAIESLLGDEGLLRLSRKAAVEKATWDQLTRGMVIEARVTGSNTGGLELKVAGQRAFMPASQIDFAHVENLNAYLNQKLRVMIIDLNRKKKNIVVSRRAVLEQEQLQNRMELLKTIEVGQVREGTVRNIQKFGAFVDLGGLDGLVHVSDMAWSHVKDPNEEVKVGQKVRVQVLKIDEEGKRISLGMKQVAPNPWDAVDTKYPAGAQVSGTVTKLTNFGAFVELEPGVEALIPMTELGWGRVNRADEVVQKGQSVMAVVLRCEPDKQRIALSLKQLQDDPWSSIAERFVEDAEITGKVTRTTDFGAFVEIEPGIEGLVHISQLSDRRVEKVTDVVREGQEVTARVVSVDPDQHRIGLSMRPPREETDAKSDRRTGKVGRQEMKKYLSREGETRAVESLMGKWGDPNRGGLKGGIG